MADVARLLRTRWIAAAVVALLLVGGGLAFAATRSASSIDLPRTTPQRLIAAVLRAGGRAPSVSGTVATHVAVGLPSLPEGTAEVGSAGLGELLGYVNGDHQVRVWASRDGIRLSELIDPAAEISYFASSRGVWLWDSDHLTAYRVVAPQGMHESHPPDLERGGIGPLSPDAIANATLRAL